MGKSNGTAKSVGSSCSIDIWGAIGKSADSA